MTRPISGTFRFTAPDALQMSKYPFSFPIRSSRTRVSFRIENRTRTEGRTGRPHFE